MYTHIGQPRKLAWTNSHIFGIVYTQLHFAYFTQTTCSAKDKINIDEAFSVLVKRIQEDRRIQAARKAEYAQNAQANKKSKGGKDKGKGGDGEGSGSKSNGKKGCTIL
ncbi:hypothetical protein SARC_00307 [Sphaeroforma arctica JP610]|uniref:Uncharacterized protein n=1 Tax=Sphaeroforma arctica JP610 TaxID=667725 RepID=A0A0L0GF50_9EUKA|nr:hypothetical protein SARC_00307 [Sphaeroforma arctica JP610]KNC87607.1 hypothetical protein SARC_00307 [Sphaeroforma arctica JP610]|eukprot:XP_014161509.1 hypothetical protein SARC_00307 [Sphaeroforma arctica JP610]